MNPPYSFAKKKSIIFQYIIIRKYDYFMLYWITYLLSFDHLLLILFIYLNFYLPDSTVSFSFDIFRQNPVYCSWSANIHTWIIISYFNNFLSLYLPSFYLFIYLLKKKFSLILSHTSIIIYSSINSLIYIHIFPIIYLSIYPSIHLSIYPLSIYLNDYV